MPADVHHLLGKSEDDLQRYVTLTEEEQLRKLFEQVWEAIRQVQLYGGQARSAASLEALSYSRLALTVATHSKSETLQGEAHRMMAYVLNANEQYADAIVHYMEAIMLLSKLGAFQRVARTRLGLIAALFMTGQYDQAIEEGRRADEWFFKNGDDDGLARPP